MNSHMIYHTFLIESNNPAPSSFRRHYEAFIDLFWRILVFPNPVLWSVQFVRVIGRRICPMLHLSRPAYPTEQKAMPCLT